MKRSAFIVPIAILIHMFIVNNVFFLLVREVYSANYNALYLNISWLVITFGFNYYSTKRKEKFITNFHKLLQVFAIYILVFMSMLGYYGENPYTTLQILATFMLMYSLMIIYRVYFFWGRDLYRSIGGNSVNVVVLGRDKNLKKVRRVFDEPELGYKYEGYFDNKPSPSKTYLGDIESSFDYIVKNDIEQVYCIVSSLNKIELQRIIDFCDNNLKRLKIIPDNKEMFYTRSMNIELYDSVPVLTARQSPLDLEFSSLFKRAFDIFFSLLVIVFVLSWLTPIIYILMQLDAPGPLIFKQKRNGLDKKEFNCFKFRSMKVNDKSNTQMVSKNDSRITKLGAILRKTSIDELPQFVNVLLGDMSVVGPRPHMEYETQKYQASVDKYLVRHYVKPGITGLAQVKGYRGEVLKAADIVNRVRLDIFYLEKWNIYLDLYIIYQTVVNVFRGEEKAY